MTTQQITKKTFSLPLYITERLDKLSENTGFSQSNMVLQALSAYLYRFEQEGTLENWLEFAGRTGGKSA